MMSEFDLLLTEHVLQQLGQIDGPACMDAINSVIRCRLQAHPGIAARLHELVDIAEEHIAGLSAAALFEPVLNGRTTLGRLVRENYPKYPYTTVRSYLGYLCWQVTQGHLLMPLAGGEVGKYVAPPDKSISADTLLKQVLSEIVSIYLIPYYLVLSEMIGTESASEHQKSRYITFAREIGKLADGESDERRMVAWTAYFLSWLANEKIGSSLAARAIGEYDFNRVMETLSWLTSASGHGSNVIGALYTLPEEYEQRRDALITFLEHGSEDRSMYWWTVMSAIEKLGDPVYCGDSNVIGALLDKVQRFIPAKNAYASLSVGPFHVINMPVWPHGQKGAYQALLNALAVVGNRDIVATLTALMPDSPYPDAVAECIFQITRRLQVSIESQHESTSESDQLTDAEVEFCLGLDKKGEHSLDEAIVHFRRAVEIDPALTNAWYNLGHCLIEKGAVVEAVRSFEEALKSEPDAVDIIANVASLYHSLGNKDKALAVSEKATSIDPSCDFAWAIRWRVYQSRNQDLEARKCAKEALLECPTSLMILELVFDAQQSARKQASVMQRIKNWMVLTWNQVKS